MYTNPVLWNGENQITAQTVDIFTKNQTIEKAVFKGEPLMCSRVDSTHFNQVKGKVIETYFNNGEIFKTDVNGNGQTYYYMEDGDSTDRYISGFWSRNAPTSRSDSPSGRSARSSTEATRPIRSTRWIKFRKRSRS